MTKINVLSKICQIIISGTDNMSAAVCTLTLMNCKIMNQMPRKLHNYIPQPAVHKSIISSQDTFSSSFMTLLFNLLCFHFNSSVGLNYLGQLR